MKMQLPQAVCFAFVARFIPMSLLKPDSCSAKASTSHKSHLHRAKAAKSDNALLALPLFCELHLCPHASIYAWKAFGK